LRGSPAQYERNSGALPLAYRSSERAQPGS
jgi:hypothetical protein